MAWEVCFQYPMAGDRVGILFINIWPFLNTVAECYSRLTVTHKIQLFGSENLYSDSPIVSGLKSVVAHVFTPQKQAHYYPALCCLSAEVVLQHSFCLYHRSCLKCIHSHSSPSAGPHMLCGYTKNRFRVLGSPRGLSRWRSLPPSLTTQVQSLEPTRWKENQLLKVVVGYLHKYYCCVCEHTHTHKYMHMLNVISHHQFLPYSWYA